MKIGLVGAPGAGKSELAIELAQALDLVKIDGYAEDYCWSSDFAIGEDATYIVNFGIALRRLTSERAYADRDDGIVVCGTMIDTATYMVCERTLFPDDDAWRRRHMSSLAVAGCMVVDLMTYDHVFYLPLAEEPENTFLSDVANTLPTSLKLFEIAYTTLDYEDRDRNLAHALNVIHAATPSE